MKLGRECIDHYSKMRRFCVFSHDELVCKIALESDRLNLGIATACYLDMVEMIDIEKKLRKNLLEWGVTSASREAFDLLEWGVTSAIIVRPPAFCRPSLASAQSRSFVCVILRNCANVHQKLTH